jgi:hypothetical protein
MQPSFAQKEKVVGAVRFELTTSCTRNKRATRLRYAPSDQGREKCTLLAGNANDFALNFRLESARGLRQRLASSPPAPRRVVT